MNHKRTSPVVTSAIIALILVTSVLRGAPAWGAAPGAAQGPTRMLAAPAVSADRLAFVYAGDLWTADLSGRNARRLTVGGGVVTTTPPAFSPDGRWIAYSAMQHDNFDVYVIPVDGGQPRRLTDHPARDLVQGFTPDGKDVLFTSDREAKFYTDSYLYRVPVEGGFPQRVAGFNVTHAAYSPDQAQMAYNSFPDAFTIWKGYRGGEVSVIRLYRFGDKSSATVPQPDTRANDVGPMWAGDEVVFRSDRNGEFNLYAYDPATRDLRQLTDHQDFPVVSASAGGRYIAYEQAGRLHLYDLQGNASTSLDIRIAADLPEAGERFAKGADYVRAADLSPSGVRAVFEMRGEIVTVPVEKGEPRTLTPSSGAHNRTPVWSPDGRSIAYFSDAPAGQAPTPQPAGDEYALILQGQDGSGEPRRFPLQGAGFYTSPGWAPHGDRIAFVDNAGTLSYLDVGTGAQHQVVTDAHFDPDRGMDYAWSPDGRWIAYTLNSPTTYRRLYLYSLDLDRSYAVTDGLADVSRPAFDGGGKYLYFRMSTDSGPLNAGLDMSALGLRESNSIYLAVLSRDEPSPLAPQSDEEKTSAESTPEATPAGAATAGAATATVMPAPAATPKAGRTPTTTMTIDVAGLQGRMIPLPVAAAAYDEIQGGAPDKVYYLKSSPGGFGRPSGSLMGYDLKARKEDLLADNVRGFIVSADGAKILADTGGGWEVLDAAAKAPDPKRLNLDAVQIRVDPRAEWAEMYADAWRINRDFFYDPKMGGVDWAAMRDKYAQFLPDLATRADLNRLLAWLMSELRVGHHFVGGGDIPAAADPIRVGLLGADYAVENGRYRFAKVFGGFTWYPQVQAPLAQPGAEVKAGEYLLAVDRRPLTAAESLYQRFENKAGKLTSITVGPDPNGAGARTLSVTPVGDELTLRRLDWIESNRLKVEQASGGRIAYVYMPDTAVSGYNFFKRYFFPQSDKTAIIVDDRFNQGGEYADYAIDLLRREPAAWYAQRYGGDWSIPGATIPGPKAMLINEASASGGDLMPWAFHQYGVGALIGKRTWGGLIGIGEYPRLTDGGFVTAPSMPIYAQDGWIVENTGVPPDIEVEQDPAQVEAGRDPQLDRAVAYLLEQLNAHPVPTIEPPPNPDRVK